MRPPGFQTGTHRRCCNWIVSSSLRTRAFCIGCGRRLRRRPTERCTGCGRPFSICDRASWSRGPWRGRLTRLVAGPPTLVDILLPVAAAAATLAAFAAPGRFDRPFQAAAALWLLTAGLWVMRLLGRIGDALGDRGGGPGPVRPFAVRMAAAPALLALCAALISAGLPLRLGFLYSRAGFERLAQSLPGSAPGEIRAGLYRLSVRGRGSALSGRPAVHLSAIGDALANDRQFVYSPGAAPADDPRYTLLGGGWYLFRR